MFSAMKALITQAFSTAVERYASDHGIKQIGCIKDRCNVAITRDCLRKRRGAAGIAGSEYCDLAICLPSNRLAYAFPNTS